MSVLYEETLIYEFDIDGENTDDKYDNFTEARYSGELDFSDGYPVSNVVVRIDDEKVEPSRAELEQFVSLFVDFIDREVEATETSYMYERLTDVGFTDDDLELIGLDYIIQKGE